MKIQVAASRGSGGPRAPKTATRDSAPTAVACVGGACAPEIAETTEEVHSDARKRAAPQLVCCGSGTRDPRITDRPGHNGEPSSLMRRRGQQQHQQPKNHSRHQKEDHPPRHDSQQQQQEDSNTRAKRKQQVAKGQGPHLLKKASGGHIAEPSVAAPAPGSKRPRKRQPAHAQGEAVRGSVAEANCPTTKIRTDGYGARGMQRQNASRCAASLEQKDVDAAPAAAAAGTAAQAVAASTATEVPIAAARAADTGGSTAAAPSPATAALATSPSPTDPKEKHEPLVVIVNDDECIWKQWEGLRLLGEGVYGRVYLVQNRETGKQAAFKRMYLSARKKDELSAQQQLLLTAHPDARKVFAAAGGGALPAVVQREVAVLGVLRGAPNVIPLQKVYIGSHRVYLSFPLIQGGTLADLLRRFNIWAEHVRATRESAAAAEASRAAAAAAGRPCSTNSAAAAKSSAAAAEQEQRQQCFCRLLAVHQQQQMMAGSAGKSISGAALRRCRVHTGTDTEAEADVDAKLAKLGGAGTASDQRRGSKKPPKIDISGKTETQPCSQTHVEQPDTEASTPANDAGCSSVACLCPCPACLPPCGMPLGLCLRIAFALLRGIAACHRNRIVHRDLKPDNLLLSWEEEPLLGPLPNANASYEALQGSQDADTPPQRSPDSAEAVHTVPKTLRYMASLLGIRCPASFASAGPLPPAAAAASAAATAAAAAAAPPDTAAAADDYNDGDDGSEPPEEGPLPPPLVQKLYIADFGLARTIPFFTRSSCSSSCSSSSSGSSSGDRSLDFNSDGGASQAAPWELRAADKEDDPSTLCLSPEIITLNYRPLEVLLGSSSYTLAVDVWSVGCILLECLTGTEFIEGSCEVSCVLHILKKFGTPSVEEWPELHKLPFMSHLLPAFPACPFAIESFLADHGRIDCLHMEPWLQLLKQLLQVDPDKRISAADALRLPIFRSLPETAYL